MVPVGGTSPESMGLSFFLRTTRGARIVGHTGQQVGFRSFLYFNPATREAVIGAVNTLNDARGDASYAAWARLVDAAVDALVP